MEEMQQQIMRIKLQQEPKCGNTSSCKNTKTTDGNNNTSLKACAACDIISYCSKSCQASDWKRHKRDCIHFRQFKSAAAYLEPEQKNALNGISYELPSIYSEYDQKYPGCHAYGIFIASSLLATKDMVLKNLHNLRQQENDSQGMLKRWQEISTNLQDFLLRAAPGDIFRTKQYNVYSPSAPQQFRNTPPQESPNELVNGKTMVEIGFVDFGIVFDSISSLDLGGDPLIVIGYDMEPFCVAKSKIMLEMMHDKEVKARSIVEVWLSSLWSKTTLKKFKNATKSILRKSHLELDPKVTTVIKYWNDLPKMKRKPALDFQAKAVVRGGDSRLVMMCCSLSEEDDRVACLRYLLTKALYEDETTMVGSVVMCSEKECIGVKQLYANCLEASPSRIHQGDCFREGSSFMGRIKMYFELNMEKYMHHIRDGSLVFTPKLGMASIQNGRLIDEVKMMNPSVISWSNTIDYIKPSTFHKIAKRMSGPDTVHYLHSCNWTRLVYGVDALDINMRDRLLCYSGGLSAIESGHEMFRGLTKQGVYHFRDICGIVLGEKFVNKFFQYFFEGERVNCSCFNGVTPLNLPCPFSRSVSTASIMFSYKGGSVNFGRHTYYFEKEEFE